MKVTVWAVTVGRPEFLSVAINGERDVSELGKDDKCPVWQSASQIDYKYVSICLTKCLLTTVLTAQKKELIRLIQPVRLAGIASSKLLLAFNFVSLWPNL